jgi:uncharacterized protein YkwD
MRHGPRHGHHRSSRGGPRNWLLGAVVLVSGGCLTAMLVGSLFAHPVRPELAPDVADPAVLAANDRVAGGFQDRPPHVSRSSARGATATTRPPTHRPTPSRRPTASPTPTPTPQSRALAYEQQVLALANTERARAGCGPLRLDAALREAAQAHSQDMADNDYFSHTGSDGSSPWDRAAEAGYSDPSGENIAAGYQTPEDVMAAWMASAGHRANILNCDSREMGLGYVANSSRGPLWTQLFGFG